MGVLGDVSWLTGSIGLQLNCHELSKVIPTVEYNNLGLRKKKLIDNLLDRLLFFNGNRLIVYITHGLIDTWLCEKYVMSKVKQ
jgi:hypothetical protein